MQLRSFFVIFLSLIVQICTAKITLKSAEPYETLAVDKTAINILTTCYGDRGHAVGIGGNISTNLIKSLSSLIIPLVLVNKFTNKVTADKLSEYRQTRYRYSLQVIVIEALSDETLYDIIKEIKKSIWWNHMAYFLILYRSSENCRGVQKWLYQTRKHDLFNSKLICFHRRMGPLVLTYNPYMIYAPKPWTLMGAYRIDKNTYFAVYGQRYRERNDICRILDFDVTTNLYGYPVQVGVIEGYSTREHIEKSIYVINYDAIIDNVLKTFVSHINGTIGAVNFKYNSSEMILFNDMLYGVGPLERGNKNPTSQPFIEFWLIAMSQHRGYKTQLQKIFSVVDVYSNIGVVVVLAVTLLFFKFFVQQPLMPAVLNIVRIVCDSGFMGLPENTPPRLFLTSVLLFAVTMQGIYQGDLASLLTTNVPERNVITWKDLMDLTKTIYVAEGNQPILEGAEFKGRVILIAINDNCAEHILRDSSAACLGSITSLSAQAAKSNLYLSKRLKPTYGILVFRPNWPLEMRLNFILGKLFEADLIIPYKLKQKQITLDNLAGDKVWEEDFRNMTLPDLAFAFVILGIGLIFASITFFIEIAFNKIRSKSWMEPVLHFQNYL